MLEATRKKNDEIDSKLLKLLAERLELCQELGEYKKKHSLPIQDKGREEQAIKGRIKKWKELGFDDEEFVREFFELIMKKSREVQHEQQ
ncbi:MAG: chorismate mutase [Nanoarchaeota archaeon]|nr:chorismate mutase [Nanoarchaeota archaeon]